MFLPPPTSPSSPLDHPQQQTFVMSHQTIDIRHIGLLHDLEATAAAGAAVLDASISTAGSDHENNSASHEKSHRSIWYMSRGFPVLCFAIVLLLSIRHGIIILRHRFRIKKCLKESSGPHGSHQPIPLDDPDEAEIASNRSESPIGTMSDSTLIEPPSPKHHAYQQDRLLLHQPESESAERRRRGNGPFVFSAWEAAQRNWLYLRTMPRWLYGPETVADALWTVGYCVLMFAFALACIPLNTEFWYLYFANGLGVLAFCQCPLIIILIQKNNPISFLTGITYQKLNYLHRASSRVALLFSWIHCLLWVPPVWRVGHFSHEYIIWGLVAISGFTGLWITSFRVVRGVAFEFFLAAHILFTIVFLVGAIFHWYRLGFWMWPCLALWGLDKTIRRFRSFYINPPPPLQWFLERLGRSNGISPPGQCEIRALGRDVMLITARRPGLKWEAGQHFYLSSPEISHLPQETHPFSVANMPNERDEVVFLVRVHSGFTRLLRDALSGDITTNIPIFLEGPYGSAHHTSSYSTVILIAGGTGVTFLSSNLLALLQPDTPQISRHIHLIWHIRYASDTAWLSPLLNEAADLLRQTPSTRLTIDIHVTKSHRADEPAPTVGFTDRLIADFGPRRLSMLVQGDFKHDIGSADASELPSAVVSDDEDDDLNGATGTNRRDLRATHVRSGSRRDGVEDDTETLLSHSSVSRKRLAVSEFGLTRGVESLISWKDGRANLRAVIEEDLRTSEGPVNVTVCGPVQLMHAARRAVRDVATPQRALRGEWPVDFYEETLGS